MLDPYFKRVAYEACEYNFTTMFMWQHMYKTMYYKEKDFAIIVGEYEDHRFTVIPLVEKDKMNLAFEFIYKQFYENEVKLSLRAVTKEFVEFLQENYPGKFKYVQERDYFDYVYLGENLRELKGRKYQKKRNHVNSFLKDYEGRFIYKKLEKEQFSQCMRVLKEWTLDKEQDDYENEICAIKKVFENSQKLDVVFGGIYIDDKLEAFTFGEYLNPDMAVIHVEKANPNIRGLYPIINKLFLENEFPDVQFVNREEDLGLEGLRKAKLSYYPERFVEKYTVTEV